MKTLHIIAFVLVIIGSLNWGLVGLGNYLGGDWNVVRMIVGSVPSLESLIYVLVGLSAIWLAATHKRGCKHCNVSSEVSM